MICHLLLLALIAIFFTDATPTPRCLPGATYPTQFLISGISKSQIEFSRHLDTLKLASSAGYIMRDWAFGDFFGYTIRFDNVKECEEYVQFAFPTADIASGDGEGTATMPKMNANTGIQLGAIQVAAPSVEEVVDYGVSWVREDHRLTCHEFEKGLDRIDQRSLPLDQRFRHPKNAGENVDIYVVDT